MDEHESVTLSIRSWTTPNHSIWSCYAFYKIIKVISLGIVITNVSLRRNGTSDEELNKRQQLSRVQCA